MTPGEVQGNMVVDLTVGEEPSHACSSDQILDLPWDFEPHVLPANGVHHNDGT